VTRLYLTAIGLFALLAKEADSRRRRTSLTLRRTPHRAKRKIDHPKRLGRPRRRAAASRLPPMSKAVTNRPGSVIGV
jgi:hypothetical protein